MGIVSMETLRVEIARVTAELSASQERERVLMAAIGRAPHVDFCAFRVRGDECDCWKARTGGSDGN